jgi:hypothetical protein
MNCTSKYGRRLFLRGLGGAVVAAPFLSSVAENAAKGQGEAVDTPRRLIVMFTHYGCLTDRWFPVKSHGDLTAADLMGTTLEPLAPHVGKILMPRGIRVMNEWTSDLSLGQGNDPDLQVLGSYFTCVPVAPNSDDPYSFDSATKFNAKPIAPSLDHVCAQQLSPEGVPLLLRVGGFNDSAFTAISYSAADTPFAGIGSLTDAFAALTGVLAGEMPAQSYEAMRKSSIIDMVRTDLDRLESFDMSAADRHKLETWKELLYETSGAVVSASCNQQVAADLGLTEANLSAPVMDDMDPLTSKVSSDLDKADLYSNLAVLTALCDQNRVIFLKYPANYVFKGLGMTIETHSMANRIGNAGMGGTCLDGVNEMIATVDRYYAEKFTHLVWQLDQIAEGDGTLLDNTATVWFQQWSDGAAFNCNNMPIIQAGSCGGHFKTGVAVNVDDGSPTLTRGNSSEACEIDGVVPTNDIKGTGTPVEVANAPVNKYYCNLMNAIGVKAGADGFPMAGGNEAVTHYGMYDETRDFIGGGTNPPNINDPGEFEELRG